MKTHIVRDVSHWKAVEILSKMPGGRFFSVRMGLESLQYSEGCFLVVADPKLPESYVYQVLWNVGDFGGLTTCFVVIGECPAAVSERVYDEVLDQLCELSRPKSQLNKMLGKLKRISQIRFL